MRQIYPMQPKPVDVYLVFGNKSDLILRRDIHEEDIFYENIGNDRIWVCDEVQGRIDEVLTADEVSNNFDLWWDKLLDKMTPKPEQSIEERLSAVEQDNTELKAVNDDLVLLMADVLGRGTV